MAAAPPSKDPSPSGTGPSLATRIDWGLIHPHTHTAHSSSRRRFSLAFVAVRPNTCCSASMMLMCCNVPQIVGDCSVVFRSTCPATLGPSTHRFGAYSLVELHQKALPRSIVCCRLSRCFGLALCLLRNLESGCLGRCESSESNHSTAPAFLAVLCPLHGFSGKASIESDVIGATQSLLGADHAIWNSFYWSQYYCRSWTPW